MTGSPRAAVDRRPTAASRWTAIALGLLATSIVLSFALAVALVRQREARLRLTPEAAYSDLYGRWRGTRDLLWHGENPYTLQATLENERGHYGKVLGAARVTVDPSGFQGFNYPLHIALLLAPLTLLPFDVLRHVATVAFAGFVLWSTFAWASLVGWPARRRGRVMVALAAAASLPAVDLITLQQLSGVVLVGVVASAGALRAGRPGWAGAILAMTTIKPQLVAVLCAGLAVWVLHDQRPAVRRFLGSFAGTAAALLLASLLLMPDWPAWFARQASDYSRENRLISIVGLIPSVPVAAATGAIIVLLTIGTFVQAGRSRDGGMVPAHAIAAALAAALLILPLSSIYDRVFLIPGVFVLLGTGLLRSPEPAGILTRIAAVVYVAALASASVGLLVDAPRLLGYGSLEPLALSGTIAQVILPVLLLALPVPVWLALICAARPWRGLGAAAGISRPVATYSR